ncbi:MAG: sigma-70 family RNA polymerase sigma factor [Clostridia bacterium]|nr:sigma-70 family RNA polymerase sigma factor [Clostridia bacterium]
MLIMPLSIAAMPEGSDREYMENIYRQHCRLMYATAWKYLNDHARVDDVVSDGCLALIGKIDTLRTLSERPLRAYIVNTIRNTALNRLLMDKRARQRFEDLPDEDLISVPGQMDTEQKILLQEELDRVWAAVNMLPEKERMVMQLKYDLCLGNDEIADKTGLAVSSVDKYIRRAREKVRRLVYKEQIK